MSCFPSVVNPSDGSAAWNGIRGCSFQLFHRLSGLEEKWADGANVTLWEPYAAHLFHQVPLFTILRGSCPLPIDTCTNPSRYLVTLCCLNKRLLLFPILAYWVKMPLIIFLSILLPFSTHPPPLTIVSRPPLPRLYHFTTISRTS